MKIGIIEINNNSLKHLTSDIISHFTLTVDKTESEASKLNELIKSLKDEKLTFVMICPEVVNFYPNFLELFLEYATDTDKVYLPLVELKNKQGEYKGVLNSSLWWPQVVEDLGVLNHSSALMQLDTTLYA